ncbi:LPS-assembly protein LptD [Roseateles violae]|uniref:LPS-assembly protein LptD n=1 Tax=Roseateles violae TaxID=3058042 RepID=A0ABT8DRA9_9BURK|nr:LPS assembly protein LptD [Pelomonas sp. PFR6]MDN3918824.1 LPS assembly protein LptD [Pelomonas sp. PFR6]
MPRFLSKPCPSSFSRLWLGVLCLCAPAVLRAQTAGPPAPDAEELRLKPVRTLGAHAKPDAKPAMVLSAKRLSSQVDQQASAEGEAELRYGELLLRAQRLSYDQTEDLARASGDVQISHSGNRFRGPELQLYVSRFEGEFLDPSYFFSQTGGGGRAKRVSFLDAKHVQAEQGNYTSCPIVADQEPAWQIMASKLDMDFENNQGVATDAVLRFQGVPILAAPTLSFPLGSGRKSGWLPPKIGLDNRSGFEFGLPYYWNIAPQRDATLTPFIMTKRGVGLDSEFRYLEPEHKGQINLDLLPTDRVADRSRWALHLMNDGQLLRDWQYRVRAERVSDDDYWKDLPDRVQSQTERLLIADLQLNRRRELSWGELQAYGRIQQWQALQGLDPSVQFQTPYQRTPQLGLRLTTAADEAVLAGYSPWGRSARLEGAVEVEYNRFDLSPDALVEQLQTGQRVHLLGHVSAPMGGPGWWLIPRVAVNAAAYALDRPQLDGRTSMNRTIPTFSIDNGWIFERDTQLLGRELRQTLEPRLLFVNTPYRRQDSPNFDSAPKDFNFDSIYTDNLFNGIDRVSDARQLTAGAISRWINPQKGEEVLRLGLVQRYLFRDQQITADGVPQTQRFSDLLLLGATHLTERWWADGTLQYNSETGRSERTVLRARYSPGPFRTVSAAYRLARGQSEQVELAWQWPLFGQGPLPGQPRAAANAGGSTCSGAWYSAGRVQYSLRDKRFTDSVVGFEYDAGCWVLRTGIERLSTGRAETNTRLMLQLELVGLSQLGSNALKVLRDNIPGYRQLSADRSASLEAPYD